MNSNHYYSNLEKNNKVLNKQPLVKNEGQGVIWQAVYVYYNELELISTG